MKQTSNRATIRPNYQKPPKAQEESNKVSVETLNNMVTLIGLLELQADAIHNITFDKTIYKNRIKQAGNQYLQMITDELYRFWKGLSPESEKVYFKQVKGLKVIISKIIYEMDQESKS